MIGVLRIKVINKSGKSWLRHFESYGGRAKDDEDRTKGLIAEIEGMK